MAKRRNSRGRRGRGPGRGPGRGRSDAGATTKVVATILTLVVIGIIGAVAWMEWKASRAPGMDMATGCLSSDPTSVTAVLLDTTDPVSRTTLMDMTNKLDQARASVPVGGYLGIYALTESPGKLGTLYEGCNPGDKSTVNPWTHNPRLQQRRWEEIFKNPIDAVEAGIGKGGKADASPIMAGIQHISLSLFDAPSFRRVPRHLVVVSDMIEHTALFSQYKSGADFNAYLASRASAQYRTDLAGADVSLLYIDRAGRRFGIRKHAAFWLKWVEQCRGNWESLVRLEGENP